MSVSDALVPHLCTEGQLARTALRLPSSSAQGSPDLSQAPRLLAELTLMAASGWEQPLHLLHPLPATGQPVAKCQGPACTQDWLEKG